MKLTSHGCSFIYGCELSSPAGSYAALIAQRLGYDYHCLAVPGSGNLQIMESVLLHASESDFCLINWTWIDRHDFIGSENESWHTLRPSLDHDHAAYFYRHLHGQYCDMLTNLAYISTAITFLQSKHIPFMMTFMDALLFEKILPEWHQPGAIVYLQDQVRPCLNNFDGLNFLDWSRKHGYAVSERWHPLDQAHREAAAYLLPIIDAIRHRA